MPGVLMVRVNGTFQPAVPAGVPGPTGPQGPAGPTGPSGQDGQATLIVGDFGTSKVPADLPTTGLIPADWDSPGNPAQPMQLIVGHSLYYSGAINPADPLAGHLFQFVTVSADPSGYIDIGLVRGPQGVPGVDGPVGPTGPQGLPSDDIWVGPDDPTLVQPTTELWFDTDDTRLLGPMQLPLGGLTGDVLVKASGADGDVAWQPARPRNVLRAQAVSTVGGAVNVMATIVSGNVTIDPTRWYHIVAGVRCINDPGAAAIVQFRVSIGAIGLNGFDVWAVADPNGLWGAWSQHWYEPGNVLLAAGGDVLAKLDAQCNIATRTYYTPRLYIFEF